MEQVRFADFTAGNRLARAREIGVEAPIETDLQLDPGIVNGRQRGIDFRKIKVDRLFAENVLPGLRRPHNQIRVGIGRRAD